jgi:hypothetical protein
VPERRLLRGSPGCRIVLAPRSNCRTASAPGSGGPASRCARRYCLTAAASALSAVARDAISLFTTTDGRRLRECASPNAACYSWTSAAPADAAGAPAMPAAARHAPPPSGSADGPRPQPADRHAAERAFLRVELKCGPSRRSPGRRALITISTAQQAWADTLGAQIGDGRSSIAGLRLSCRPSGPVPAHELVAVGLVARLRLPYGPAVGSRRTARHDHEVGIMPRRASVSARQ